MRVGVVGTGVISRTYLEVLDRVPGVEVVAVADLERERATATARTHGLRALVPDELYADSDVETVLNLTTPVAHAPVTRAALAGGKHVYSEKPLAATRTDARALLETAAGSGLRLGCAPDTVLGTGVQTARALLDRGAIGAPTAATAFFVKPGHEHWHPDPEFYYYRPGGGPLFDMGPYYLSALVTLLGPVRRVTALATRGRAWRTVGSGPRQGTTFPVEVDTHVTGVLQHRSGLLTTVITSYDAPESDLPCMEIYGREGTLQLNPNQFDGEVRVFTPAGGWTTAATAGGYAGCNRGFGLADMARAIRTGGPHRASGELAVHVVDAMESMLESAARGCVIEVATTAERPAPVPLGSAPGPG